MTTLHIPRTRDLLQKFDFPTLFIEELGWDRHKALPLEVAVDGTAYSLHALAEKRGMVAYGCAPDSRNAIPDHATRRKIEKQAAKSAHEHLIIYTDGANTTQVWQWVKRELGRPAACREHTFRKSQPGDALIQKLQTLAFSLEEEETLTIAHVAGRARQAFDVDRVTKRFYDRFKTEHTAFLKFIKDIQAEADRERYASLMLNRLMFVYFIQKKGFLDGDLNYLRTKLRLMQERKNVGAKQASPFLTFYRHFLLRLFHEGLGQQPHSRLHELDALLGKVPYLNGGLFEVHELEQDNPEIEIPDQAFERIFDFFDAYQWHLDERPLRADNEINPDVLGYIFEKYINQKQMGAYYTKEDITGYISENTVIPFLFDTAEKKCAIAFRQDGAVWGLLRENPDRYLYEAVRRGVIDPTGRIIPENTLPDFVQKGMHDPQARMFERRYNLAVAVLTDPEGNSLALPTETWREYVERRKRCLELRAKLTAGEIRSINDLITYNLDIRQFAQDVIENCEGPELLRAFWHAIEELTVLDPTCGSGAFLFAALNILEPLYEACLDRMQSFVDDLDRSGEKHRPEKFGDFRKILDRVQQHPNRRYFILKSIIINNLYGVDIMEEAVEICKLRLFLKLVAQVERVEDIEPLPDIDFNIRAGNTLVGFTSLEDVKTAITRDPSGQLKLMDTKSQATLKRIEEGAEIADRAFQKFHEMQTEHGMDAKEFAAAKQELRRRLDTLSEELDRYLAREYGIDVGAKGRSPAFTKWRANHQLFHWFVEFYGIMKNGGFGVIIGNPPYVEYSKVRRDYQVKGFLTEPCGNLYAMCTERSFQILHPQGRFGFIVQAPIVSTQRMAVVRKLLTAQADFLAFSTYDDRPAKLFDGMNHCRVAIVLARHHKGPSQTEIFTTRYHKWYDEERGCLFDGLSYLKVHANLCKSFIPKFRCEVEASIFCRLQTCLTNIGRVLSQSPSPHQIFYKITGVGHWFTFTLQPPKFWRDGVEGPSTRENSSSFRGQIVRDTVFCVLWSTVHYWLYQVRTNCRDFNPSDLEYPPLTEELAQGVNEAEWFAQRITDCLEETAEVAEASYKVGGSVRYQKFRPRFAKPIIDEIDRVLARHYGFTDEELDFIINYDIKYRMGRGAEGEEENGE